MICWRKIQNGQVIYNLGSLAHSITKRTRNLCHYFKRRTSPLCTCGATEDATHVLLHCLRYDGARHKLYRAIIYYAPTPEGFVANETNFKALKQFSDSWRTIAGGFCHSQLYTGCVYSKMNTGRRTISWPLPPFHQRSDLRSTAQRVLAHKACPGEGF